MRKIFHRCANISCVALTFVLPQPVLAAPEGAIDNAVATSIQALAKQAQSVPANQTRWYDERAWLARFYAPGGYAPVWTHDGRSQPIVSKALAELRAAATRGLDPADYEVDRLVADAPRGDGNIVPDRLARFDVALTAALLRYLCDLHFGRVRVDYNDTALPDRLKAFDPVDRLRGAILANQLAPALSSAEPDFPFYVRLKSLLARYRDLALKPLPELSPLPKGARKIAPGGRYAGVPALRDRLAALGDLPANVPAISDRYEEPLVSAVKLFQLRHGLDADGVLGKATLAALNVSPAQRVRQIELSLERLRWLPYTPRGPFVAVNVPSFRLMVFDSGLQPKLSMRAIVGKAKENQTPAFIGEMQHIEFNPYWNVPPSIATDELLPKIAGNAGYLAANDMELVSTTKDGQAGASVEGSDLDAVAAGKLRIRQRPGPKNPLGSIKFVLPNRDDIYLHATPAQELFNRARRDFSHGCIRVEHPVALAQFVLRDQPEWTESAIEEAMAPQKTRVVKLKTPIPVVIFYVTAVVQEEGQPSFLPDIYHFDDALERALAARKARAAHR